MPKLLTFASHHRVRNSIDPFLARTQLTSCAAFSLFTRFHAEDLSSECSPVMRIRGDISEHVLVSCPLQLTILITNRAQLLDKTVSIVRCRCVGPMR